jgi:hypothetical protein
VAFAVGGGSGDGWFGVLLVVASAQLVVQILTNAGKMPARWPWGMSAETRAGKAAWLVLNVAIIAFCILGLITTE